MITVDVHAHVDVAALEALVADRPELAAERAANLATFGQVSTNINIELSKTTYRSLLDDPLERLRRMDSGGVDVQAVSVSPTLYHYWAAPALAADIVATANESIADFVRQEPTRFVGLATVALQHGQLAADQLQAAAEGLGMRGVEISSSAGSAELDDRTLDPFWAMAERLGSFVFIHPWGCTLGERLATSYLGNVVGNPTETNLALHRMIFGGVFDRFPNLKVCAAHGGGYFPHYLGRAQHAYHYRPESRTMALPPRAYLPQIYADSLVYEADELRRLVQVLGADHVVLGTDYPFDMGVENPLDRLNAVGLPDTERAAIAGGTAARLLNISQPSSP